MESKATTLSGICQSSHHQKSGGRAKAHHINVRLRDAEAALQAVKEWAQVTLDSIGDAVVTTDLVCRVTYMNRVAERLTGWSSVNALGKPLAQVLMLVDGKTLLNATNPAQRAMEENRTVGLAMDCLLIRPDGSQLEIEDSAAPIHDQDGCIKGAVIVFHDACQSPIQSSKLAYQAQHDPLTGLPNRILLSERLSRAIGLAKRHQHQVALMYLDLDAFKPINDALGHGVGDRLLQSVAYRLSQCVRDTDTICRQGGDEFVVLQSETEKPQDAITLAQKILSALDEPHQVGNHALRITTSIGISLYPDHGMDAGTLLNNADTAMYHAKNSGCNQYRLFSASMNDLVEQHSHIESQLQRGLKDGALFLDFQPRVELATGKLMCAEALVRWRNPTLGLMQPSTFLPVAETHGLIVPIGHWVLHEACRQLQAWRDEGREIVPIAVNMSVIELHDKRLAAYVADVLANTGVEAHFLEVEVSGSSLVHHLNDVTISTLSALRALGIRIAMDDFGAGDTSLTHLQRFPLDTINIAPCFVQEMLNNLGNANFIRALISFGQQLSLRVIAKGVETTAQFEHLKLHGCDGAQGFLFSKPLSANDFRLLLGAAPLSDRFNSTD
ncbi:EAL domain-containing protein [Halomonas sp. 7T]|uniref:putative bifunctional diguanylate cyclase/phosphodiesterase n=1 Tax=Halomonas sp. 7T TaxID=2893469 RepID=UPI0021D85FEB|nr:EAL domain-containing protein [Halomonas sp. 7T]UXZ54891.1 EAL domain-containing protein [Halomonas sp. 7T]